MLLGRLLRWLMAPHALLLARDKFDTNLEVLIVVVVKLDVVRTSASAVEETEVDKSSVLIGATETADCEDSLDELPTNDGIEVQSWTQIQYVDSQATTLERLLDPVYEVAIKILIRDDLHIRNVLWRTLRKRKAVVRVSRAGTSVISAATSVRRRTITVSLIAISVSTRRRRWGSVLPVSVPFAITSVTSISAISSAAVASPTGRISLVPSSAIVRRTGRTRASSSIDRTQVGPGVLLRVTVTLGFADF
jgi:hypothetical protein